MSSESSDWHEPKPETFSLDIAHEVVEKYQPEFIGKGNEHLVYRSPEHPDVVIKVSFEMIEASLYYLDKYDGDTDAMYQDPQWLSYFSEWKTQRQEMFQELREHFGAEHTLPQRLVAMHIPRVPKIIDAITEFHYGTKVEQDHLPNTLTVIAAIQKSSDVYDDGNYESLGRGYYDHSNNVYFNQLEGALFNRTDESAQLPEQPTLPENSKPAVVRDFVTRSISYTNDTGKILDLAGKGNAVLHRQEGGFTYSLIDAVYPGLQGDMLKDLRGVIDDKLAGIDERSIEEWKDLSSGMINALNYIMYINNFAARLGMIERIDWLNDEYHKEHWPEIRSILEKLRDQWLANLES